MELRGWRLPPITLPAGSQKDVPSSTLPCIILQFAIQLLLYHNHDGFTFRAERSRTQERNMDFIELFYIAKKWIADVEKNREMYKVIVLSLTPVPATKQYSFIYFLVI
jgi:hypothetical protein